MRILRKIFFGLAIIFAFILGIFFSFTLWNNISYQNYPMSKIGTNTVNITYSPPKLLKVMTYNIHYGIGLNGSQKQIDKEGVEKKLDALVRVLKKSNADIIFMQEVDFYSSRSHKINQAKYLAEKGGYPFYATAHHWKQKLFPDLYGRHGPLNHGLCILSRFPLKNNQSQSFPLIKDAPFFIKWLCNPHGAQKVEAVVGDTTITLINIHLDPWSIKARQQQIQKVLSWTQNMEGPMIIGGDFNVEPPEAQTKSVSHLKDIPWFISLNKEELEQEQTVQMIKQKGFSTLILEEQYLKNPSIYFTFPSNDPKVKLDYIFTGKGAKIILGRVFIEAANASDHLPILAEISY